MGLGSGYTEHDSEEEEGPVMRGNGPAGGIKAPAIKVKKSDLIKTVKKLDSSEARKDERTQKIEKCKKWSRRGGWRRWEVVQRVL